MIEEKSEALRREIASELDQSSETIVAMQQYLEEDVPNLYDKLRDSVKEREQTEEILLKQI